MLATSRLELIAEYESKIKAEKRVIAESVDILKRHVRAGSKMRNMMDFERTRIIHASKRIQTYERYIQTLRTALTRIAHI